LPFPSEICELITCNDELLSREHSFALEILVCGYKLGVKEVFYAVKHPINKLLINRFLGVLKYENGGESL